MTDTSEQQVEEAAPAEAPTMFGALRADALGQVVLHVSREQYVSVIKQLLDDGYEMCIDLTAVDYLAFPTRRLPAGIAAERFEIIVNLLSLTARQRIRIRVQVPEDDPSVPTLFDLYPGTEAQEREVYDMFGITFDDHPDLTRILMPEDWEGHPLRKDYEVGHIPVQFSSANPGGAGPQTGNMP
ncbi:MAG: NADH-quinone oxidoreductase subunit C [Ilumatobacteraceae bacterium]